jgi:hypothetical protein
MPDCALYRVDLVMCGKAVARAGRRDRGRNFPPRSVSVIRPVSER